MKMRIIVLFSVISIFAAGWIWRYTAINNYYKQISNIRKTIHSANEIVRFDSDYLDKGIQAEGYWIKVNKFEILEYSELLESYSITLSKDTTPPDKVALLYITLGNESNTNTGVALTELMLHGIDSYTSIERDILFAINPALKNNTGIKLSTGREYDLILPFGLCKQHYSVSTWNKIDIYDFFLRITFFPVAKDIKVQ